MKASLVIVFAVSYGVMAALIWQIMHDKPYRALVVIAVLWTLMLPTLSTKDAT